MTIQDAPQKIIEAWLHFHKTELCQQIDAVFAFNKAGVEIWCVVESDKNHRKLQQLFEPMERSHRIEFYPTRPPAKKKSAREMSPPPSLCENQELRANLGDPSFHSKSIFEEGLELEEIFPPNEILKQRLMAFAGQTLDWNRKIKRYAMDMPGLISVALNIASALDTRKLAQTVCIEHAENLQKILNKLRRNLVFAHPKSIEPISQSSGTEKAEILQEDLRESAARISETAQNIVRRVYRFIYPEKHTVDLEDLRRPGLLESLGELERIAQGFQAKLENFHPGK